MAGVTGIGGRYWRGAGYYPPSPPMFTTSYSKPKVPEKRRKHIVITVRWCTTDDSMTNVIGQCGHPFPDNDANSQRLSWTRQVPDERYGGTTEVTETKDICGYHWELQNPFQAMADTPKMVVKGKHEKD
jgi:hypothetical protein